MQLCVLSWNIWLQGDLAGVIELIKNSDADIVGLQEVVPEREPNIVESMNALGYQGVCAPVLTMQDGNTLCNAVFGKFPIVREQTHILTDTQTTSENPWENKKRIAVEAEFDLGGTTLHALSTHLAHTHQKQTDIQDAQARALLAATPKERAIVMGDFNAEPDSSVIKAMRATLVDTDPSAAPTWSMYPEGCHICLPQSLYTRLDYMFVTKDIKVSHPRVLPSKASDHLPVSAVIEV